MAWLKKDKPVGEYEHPSPLRILPVGKLQKEVLRKIVENANRQNKEKNK